MPEIIKLDFNDEDSSAKIQFIKGYLERGGVIAYPTDTFYALGVNPFNAPAVAKVFQLKRRSADKPLLVLVDSKDQIPSLSREMTVVAETLTNQFWPAPLTLLMQRHSSLPLTVTGGTEKIGIRQPDCQFARRLIRELGHPLTATSANLTGKPNCRTAEDIRVNLNGSYLIVDGGDTEGGKESTIIDSMVSPPQILREGALPIGLIESALKVQLTRPS